MKSKIILLLSALFLMASCGNAAMQLAKKALSLEAKNANEMLAGKHVDPVTLCDSIIFDGKDLIYNYEIDEEQVSFEKIDQEVLKSQIQSQWETNPQLETIKEYLKAVEGSVIYNYSGSATKEAFTISIGL